MTIEQLGSHSFWFVGSTQGTEEFTEKFIDEGRWQNFGGDRNISLTKTMRSGERIAIKSTFVRKNGLPFEGNGNFASVMLVKAVGTIESNPGDGRSVKVIWDTDFLPKEWYFYTNRQTVWKLEPTEPFTTDLISFAFEGADQDLEQYLNHWYWQDRYGVRSGENSRFSWTPFYQSIARKLLEHRDDRSGVLAEVQRILKSHGLDGYIQDTYADGTKGPLKDICPFTIMGSFNRQISTENRIKIATDLADFLGVEEKPPSAYDGIPVLNNQRSWFFSFEYQREPKAIDQLWNMFAVAIEAAETDDPELHRQFEIQYDLTSKIRYLGWNLTMGLYWINPWEYPTLEAHSRNYIQKILGIAIGAKGESKRCSAADYVELKSKLESNFKDDQYSVHSFPELSLAAWHFIEPNQPSSQEEDTPTPLIRTYSIDDVVSDGCFIEASDIRNIIERLRSKKNLILQGPPGTGKTWLARRLAFAVIGEKSDRKVRVVQFHPNLSYEDFVRGWRPQGDGKLEQLDGPFMEMVELAKTDPESNYAVVIEEINRGNPAQIFGELLTLLESDKRNPSEGMELSYRKYPGERVHIPSNLYVVGTMNMADRSLALVDLALRRRFAFVDLEPRFGSGWQSWVTETSNIPSSFLNSIKDRIVTLNNEITADPALGKQFCLGHSFVTPRQDDRIDDPLRWFEQVVKTEIRPQLEEYWFDDPEKARLACEKLIDGLT